MQTETVDSKLVYIFWLIRTNHVFWVKKFYVCEKWFCKFIPMLAKKLHYIPKIRFQYSQINGFNDWDNTWANKGSVYSSTVENLIIY